MPPNRAKSVDDEKVIKFCRKYGIDHEEVKKRCVGRHFKRFIMD